MVASDGRAGGLRMKGPEFKSCLDPNKIVRIYFHHFIKGLELIIRNA